MDLDFFEQLSENDCLADPTVNRPVIARPAVARPAVDRPVADRPVADRPVTDRPVADRPVADHHVVDHPVADRPVADRHVADRHVAGDQPQNQRNNFSNIISVLKIFYNFCFLIRKSFFLKTRLYLKTIYFIIQFILNLRIIRLYHVFDSPCI